METNSLDAIFDGGDSQAMPAPAPKMEPVEQRQELVPQTGEKEQPSAPPAEATDDAPPPGKWIPLKAHEDERKKRQELERRLAEYERQIQQPKQQPPPPPDWIADPEGAAERMRLELAEQHYRFRVDTGFELLRERYADLDEVTDFFASVARQDPRLAAQVRDHPNPVKFAYDMGRKIKAMQEIGSDPDAYRKRLEDEVRAKVLAEMGQQPVEGGELKPVPQKSLPAPVPKSLARDVSQQPRASNGQWAGPKSLSDILGD